MNVQFLLTLIPDIYDWIKNYYTLNGKLPTKEELQAQLKTDEDKYIDRFNQWLIDHPEGN